VKVKELKIGMLLTPTDKRSQFSTLFGGYVIGVTREGYVDRRDSAMANRTAIYLGRREDVNVEVEFSAGYENGLSSIGWSNRFVLVKNRIFAVEPSEWKYIKPVDVGDTDQRGSG
jgi:hypothetical protein